jgi:hypothetical protein
MRHDEGSTAPSSRPDHLIVTTLAFWAIAFALLVVFSRTAIRQEFFFDEAWRADVIRSSNPLDRLKAFKTPLPPLWPMLLHFTGHVIRGRFTALRLQATALAAFLPAVLGQLSRLASASLWPAVRQRRADAAGLVATIACCGFVGSVGLGAYLNDYVFQAALTGAMVLAWLGIDREWWKPIWSVPIMLAMAVGTNLRPVHISSVRCAALEQATTPRTSHRHGRLRGIRSARRHHLPYDLPPPDRAQSRALLG